MRRLPFLLLTLLLLAGCAGTPAAAPSPGLPRYEATFLTLFDTVTTIKGYAADEAGFQAMAQEIHDGLLEYHQLYDIYNEYPGVVNLKTVNDAAGEGGAAHPGSAALLPGGLYRDGGQGQRRHGQRPLPMA